MNIKIVNTLPEKEWRGFVNNHPNGTIFHTPEMFQVYSHAQGYQPELWAATSDGEIGALFLPVRVHLLKGVLAGLTTRAISYGGALLASEGTGEQALNNLLRVYQSRARTRSLFTEIRQQYDFGPFRPILQSSGFTHEDHLNFRVDLALPIDRVWKNIHSSARNHIKNALRKEQVKIVEVKDDIQTLACYELLKLTYDRAQIPLADYSLFKAAFEILYPKGMIQVFLGQVDGANVAAMVNLLFKGTIYSWYMGFDRNYSALTPNDLMVWNALKWGSENGFSVFDFGGAGKPSEPYGPREFKAKFGGMLVNYGRDVSINNPFLYKISVWGYHLIRRFL